MRHVFNLPDPGEGLADADIVQWLVEPGDEVKVNQTIVEIETAKSLVELPSPWDGTVLEILAPVGANVAVGAPILAMEVAGEESEPDGDEPAESDGLSGHQRFFWSWAQAWRTKARDEEVVRLLAIDPHSPPEFRCNAVVRNIDGFHDAFATAEGDDLWLAPEDRVRIW